jgi:hypothetical protein
LELIKEFEEENGRRDLSSPIRELFPPLKITQGNFKWIYIHNYKLLGSVIYPEIALAAATALFAKYIFELLNPFFQQSFYLL